MALMPTNGTMMPPTQRCRNQKDEKHLNEVADRGRILERHRRVRIPEAAAVGAELLDRDLRRRRAQAQHLLAAFQRAAERPTSNIGCSLGRRMSAD
jgi:hypothetical protein